MKENENIWSKMEFIVNRSNRLWHTGSRSLDVRCFLLYQRKLPQCRWWGMEPQVGTASDQRVWLVMARHPGVLKWQLNDSASSLMTFSFRDNYMWMKTAKLVFFSKLQRSWSCQSSKLHTAPLTLIKLVQPGRAPGCEANFCNVQIV